MVDLSKGGMCYSVHKIISKGLKTIIYIIINTMHDPYIDSVQICLKRVRLHNVWIFEVMRHP